jgi:hypothetical protein
VKNSVIGRDVGNQIYNKTSIFQKPKITVIFSKMFSIYI